jgi:hypothetical protein
MRAIRVPVDPAEPLEIVVVESHYPSIAKAIGGPCEFIERFRCPLTPAFNLVGVLDENGQYNGQPENQRAWPLYPMEGYTLKGPVLVMQEGMTPDGPDFVDLEYPEEARALVVGLLERRA